MATPLAALNNSPNLETQLFLVLEQFSDLQKDFATGNPDATPNLVVPTYTRDHLSGQVTGTFAFGSNTIQENDGTVTIVPVISEF